MLMMMSFRFYDLFRMKMIKAITKKLCFQLLNNELSVIHQTIGLYNFGHKIKF